MVIYDSQSVPIPGLCFCQPWKDPHVCAPHILPYGRSCHWSTRFEARITTPNNNAHTPTHNVSLGSPHPSTHFSPFGACPHRGSRRSSRIAAPAAQRPFLANIRNTAASIQGAYIRFCSTGLSHRISDDSLIEGAAITIPHPMGSVYITVRVTQFCSLSFPRSGSCPNLSDRDFDLNVHKVAEVILAQFEALVLRKGGELRANNASSGVTPSTPSEWHSLIRDRLCLSKIFSNLVAYKKSSRSMPGPNSTNVWWAETPESRGTSVRGSREMREAQAANLKQEPTSSNRPRHHASPPIKPSRLKIHKW
ncbi:hypothetical protein BJV77DRAFT_1152123 [Russula vinacea]|nr:hypothetical protein BJV77DRAFT_1152123 [Russula vinacea]